MKKLLLIAVIAMAFIGCENVVEDNKKRIINVDATVLRPKNITISIGDKFYFNFGFEVRKWVAFDFNESGIYARMEGVPIEKFFTFEELEADQSFKIIK